MKKWTALLLLLLVSPLQAALIQYDFFTWALKIDAPPGEEDLDSFTGRLIVDTEARMITSLTMESSQFYGGINAPVSVTTYFTHSEWFESIGFARGGISFSADLTLYARDDHSQQGIYRALMEYTSDIFVPLGETDPLEYWIRDDGPVCTLGIENDVYYCYPGMGNKRLISAPVPEPSTIALLGLGLAGLTLRRRLS